MVNVLKFQTFYSILFVPKFCFLCSCFLTMVLLNPVRLTYANNVDPDQLASEKAN